MKKVIAILAVLAIVAGFAFATDTQPSTGNAETHKITVKTTVDLILPVFGFESANNVVTNGGENAVKFADSASYEATDSTVLLNSNKDISQAAISEVFTIKSRAICNIVEEFQLKVEATAFKHTTTVNNAPFYTTAGDISIVLAPNTIASTEHISVTGPAAISDQDSTKVLTATYTGRQVTAGVTLGTATITWPQDPDAKPGNYTADVTLTVTVV